MNENLPALLPSQHDFQTLQMIAKSAFISKLYTTQHDSEQKIFMVLLAAQEMGIKPFVALNGGLWNIKGKIEISARLMSSMIRRAGHSINIIQCDSNVCILEGKRKDNGDTFRSQFTIEDAKKAGLTNNDVWKKYTEDMLYSRALSRLGRRLFADIIGMSYVEGEIKDEEEEAKRKRKESKETPDNELELVETEFKEPEIDPKIEEENKKNELFKKFGRDDQIHLMAYIIELSKTYNKTILRIIEVAEENIEKFTNNYNIWKSKITQPTE